MHFAEETEAFVCDQEDKNIRMHKLVLLSQSQLSLMASLVIPSTDALCDPVCDPLEMWIHEHLLLKVFFKLVHSHGSLLGAHKSLTTLETGLWLG
jgi:hypothetical protein